MTERRMNRPEWYFHGLLWTPRLWALGYYRSERRNWRILFVAIGPLRLRFVRCALRAERMQFDLAKGAFQ